jgi:hypothetical protein
MAAEIGILNISVEDIPSVMVKGTTPIRRAKIFITGTATATDTLNVATYVPGLSMIEGIDYMTAGQGALMQTGSATITSTTITFQSTGTVQMGIIGQFS